MGEPSGASHTRVSPQRWQTIAATWLVARPGSRLSVEAPPCIPSLIVPPRTGPCALAAVDSNDPAAARPIPRAALRPRKSRRDIRPFATRPER